jgi:hypothetical protein
LIYVRKPDNLDNSLEVVALMLVARGKYPAQRMLEGSLLHLTAQLAQADPSDVDQSIVGVLVHAAHPPHMGMGMRPAHLPDTSLRCALLLERLAFCAAIVKQQQLIDNGGTRLPLGAA